MPLPSRLRPPLQRQLHPPPRCRPVRLQRHPQLPSRLRSKVRRLRIPAPALAKTCWRTGGATCPFAKSGAPPPQDAIHAAALSATQPTATSTTAADSTVSQAVAAPTPAVASRSGVLSSGARRLLEYLVLTVVLLAVGPLLRALAHWLEFHPV